MNQDSENPAPPAEQDGLEPKDQAVALIAKPRLPYHPGIKERFEVDIGQWRVLVDATFPAAESSDSVIMALNYCKARRLDVFKRPVAIVPVWDSKRGRMVDTLWPTIGELRITASRTGEYAGCDETEFGEEITQDFVGKIKKKGNRQEEVSARVTFPSWAQVRVYRMVKGKRCCFTGPKVYWLETFGQLQRSGVPNSMWSRRPFGQIEKCAEAAALRKAFPEEIGNEYIDDEMANADPPAPIDANKFASALMDRLDKAKEERREAEDSGDHDQKDETQDAEFEDISEKGASDSQPESRDENGSGGPSTLQSEDESARPYDRALAAFQEAAANVKDFNALDAARSEYLKAISDLSPGEKFDATTLADEIHGRHRSRIRQAEREAKREEKK